MAVSQDGLNWQDLNHNQPILQSSLGTTGIRDPFIIADRQNKKYYILATDLKYMEITIDSPSLVSNQGVEGPTCYQLVDQGKWILLVDNYAQGGYYPLETSDLSSGHFHLTTIGCQVEHVMERLSQSVKMKPINSCQITIFVNP